MKYAIGAIIPLLVIGGILLGFNLAKNTNSNDTTINPTNNTSASSNSTRSLNLSDKGLTKVTSGIYNKTDTVELILSNNNIQTLPSEMGKMINVVILKIDHNNLGGSLIGEIRKMTKLKGLDVSYNRMTGMPAEIGQLGSLETLNYSFNNISGLPNELSKLRNNLKEFNLTGNPLSQDKINKLKSELPNTNIIY